MEFSAAPIKSTINMSDVEKIDIPSARLYEGHGRLARESRARCVCHKEQDEGYEVARASRP